MDCFFDQEGGLERERESRESVWVGRGLGEKTLTQHVALGVLTTALIGNVGLDAQERHGSILDRVFLEVEAADEGEALALVDLLRDAIEDAAEGLQGERLTRDLAPVQLEGCAQGSSASNTRWIADGALRRGS